MIALLALLAWGLIMGLMLGSAGLAALPARSARGRARPISVVIPLADDHPGLTAATESVLGASPETEIILAARDPGHPAVARASAAGRCRVVQSDRRAARNPKIANLMASVAASQHEILLIKDGLSRMPDGEIAAMQAALDRPGVGLVAAVPIARAPASFAAQVEGALINTHGARLLLAAARLGQGFGIGAAMMMRAADLARAGGLGRADAIADDAALARTFAGIGLRTALAGTADQDLGARSWPEVWRRHVRWALCRRLEAPHAFVGEPLVGLPAASLCAWLAAPALPGLILATPLAWIGAECALAASRGWPLSVSTPAAILVREALLPLLWLTALWTRRVRWGSEIMVIGEVRRAASEAASLRPDLGRSAR